MSFERQTIVRFREVDAAGIVFYPRFFEMLSIVVEEWSATVLGIDFRTMHLDMGFGIPVVTTSATFVSPSILGDKLTIQIVPRRLGTSSCHLSARFQCGDEHRLTIEQTVVWMDLARKKACPWPDELRARLEAELISDEES